MMETTTSANAKRNNNIQIAAESIDGTLLSPGEVFSLNQTVGKRTQARGFRTAPVFVNAEKVPGVGGGVSQITGTLFNAAALAGRGEPALAPCRLSSRRPGCHRGLWRSGSQIRQQYESAGLYRLLV